MTDFWKAKLAGWIHDPAEKAFVLMRDPGVGHEDGTVAFLRDVLGISDSDFIRQADWIAAGADRPSWPDDNVKYSWPQIRFANSPILIHPLSGDKYDLSSLREVEAPHIKFASMAHFADLIEKKADGSIDYRLTHLAFWRFGYEPELVAREIGSLWQHLPADSRTPDNTIWEHLNLVSALSGAMHNDTPALLSMSFGPVQSFIAQARSVSDFWAGSHLLSSLVWQGLTILAEEFGPDAVLFPNLRAVAAVDRWILESVPEERRDDWKERFKQTGAKWLEKSTDENPLFAATLPNKFVAIVPRSKAEDMAERIAAEIRRAALQWAEEAAKVLFGVQVPAHVHEQIVAQLKGFPETYWSVAEWPVPAGGAKGLPSEENLTRLRTALASFYPTTDATAPGLFGKPVWKVLNREVDLDGVEFWSPNAGLLYAAVYEIADRSLAISKTARPFNPLKQEGFRCSLCGEREWLSPDHSLLKLRPGKRDDSPWAEFAGKNGIKKGEHLCAYCTLKRLWPRLFSGKILSTINDNVSRFVVSTHAMAVANTLARLSEDEIEALKQEIDLEKYELVPLPKKLLSKFSQRNLSDVLKRIPSILDSEDQNAESDQRILKLRLPKGEIEAYYALLKMDGDRMGAWLSGTEDNYLLRYKESFHPRLKNEIDNRGYEQRNDNLAAYLESYRPVSPARHTAISAALNDFSGNVARFVIEECFMGRLIYSGGDDVLAMLAVSDLLPAISLLRAAYSGNAISKEYKGFNSGKGFVRIGGKLMRMMGERATASIGAVVAHHKDPLSAVLRALNEVEHGAKAHGRNAFSVRIRKRAGGEVGITAKFDASSSGTLDATIQLSAWLKNEDVSRRAVYNSVRWLKELPTIDPSTWRELVKTNLAYQMTRQSRDSSSEVPKLAEDLVDAALNEASRSHKSAADILESILVTAEFFARETHAGGQE